jgi:hypothetical protein
MPLLLGVEHYNPPSVFTKPTSDNTRYILSYFSCSTNGGIDAKIA